MTNRLVDPVWEERAKENACKGYPWIVWGSPKGVPLGIMDSFSNESDAQLYASQLRVPGRLKRKDYIIIVNYEG
jgi:hypothetical protein